MSSGPSMKRHMLGSRGGSDIGSCAVAGRKARASQKARGRKGYGRFRPAKGKGRGGKGDRPQVLVSEQEYNDLCAMAKGKGKGKKGKPQSMQNPEGAGKGCAAYSGNPPASAVFVSPPVMLGQPQSQVSAGSTTVGPHSSHQSEYDPSSQAGYQGWTDPQWDTESQEQSHGSGSWQAWSQGSETSPSYYCDKCHSVLEQVTGMCQCGMSSVT